MDRLEWLAWRKQGIGSSDAAAIMGVSPWKTQLDCYEDKISPEINEESSYIMNKGNQMEPKIRAYFELTQARSFSPKLVVMAQFPQIRASLDGADESGEEIAEIKLVGLEDHEGAKKGIIPEKYYPQVQHQLMVTGAKLCHYISYRDSAGDFSFHAENLHRISISSNPDYQGKLLAAELQFWESVTKKKPPIPSDRDYKQLRGFAKQANLWKRLKLKMDALETELEEAREALLTAAKEHGHPRLTIAGVKILLVSKVGNVNYKSIPELKNVDLEKYRGAGSSYYKLEV